MNKQVALERALAGLQNAALDPSLWPRTMAAIGEACEVRGNALVVGGGHGDNIEVSFGGFYEHGQRRRDLEGRYFNLYYSRDERLPRLRQLPDRKLVHVSQLYTDEERKTSPAYNEWMGGIGSQNSLNVRLDGPEGSRIVLTFTNPVQTEGWGSDQVDMIDQLAEPIRQFVRVRQAVAAAQALGSSLNVLLDNTRTGVIHLDRLGRLIEANPRALDLLRRADGLCDRGGYLSAWLPADNDRLQALLSRALPPLGGQGAAGTVTVARPSGHRKLVLHANPVEDRWLALGSRRVAAFLLVVEPGTQATVNKDMVAQAFGLTAAETEVAVMMSEGRTPREIARLTDRGIGTVYNLTSRAYRKLGVSRRMDLVRMLWQLSDGPRPRR